MRSSERFPTFESLAASLEVDAAGAARQRSYHQNLRTRVSAPAPAPASRTMADLEELALPPEDALCPGRGCSNPANPRRRKRRLHQSRRRAR
jgi:hypothetical protein